MQKIEIKEDTHTIHQIRQVKVYSPVDFYESQKMFVTYIIDCLDKNQNALIQSPTGTGKTLSLLCSTLSWAYHHQQKSNKIHRIIYTSRTHTQLNQVICELKRTPFDVKVAQLASRDHTCLNDDLKQLSGQSKQLECRLRTLKKEGKFCKYFHHEEFYNKLPLTGTVSDLEQMIQRGKHENFCPYYYEKSCKSKANLILMPYNYLLDDRLIGEDLSALVKDSIIIFDEGHNIPSVCEQSQQFTINLQIMQRALHHISQLRQSCLKIQRKSGQQETPLKSIPEQLELHADYISSIHTHFQTLDLPPEQSGIMMNSFQFLDFLHKGTLESAKGPLKNQIGSLYLSSGAIKADIMLKPYWALNSWLMFLNFINEVYKNELTEDKDQKQSISKKAYQFQISYQGSNIKIALICLEPKICFQKLQSNQPKSIILTSGTLSPLNSWPLELSVNFAKPLACPHILGKQQVNACVLTKTYSKTKFNFSFENRENKQLYLELGRTLVDIVQHTKGGIVVLFPSYSVLEKVKSQLSNNGYMSKLYLKKKIFLEMKNSNDFKSTLNLYFDECLKPKGAMFFALARGKISEGLDLSDQKCRALIMVGVPYPAIKDIKVNAKMSYLDEKSSYTKSITGNQWYICETIRCINQSIGRIIRHKKDYGSIYLIDERFKKADLMSQISSWVKQCIKIYQEYEQFLFKMEIFNKELTKQENKGETFFKSIAGTQLGTVKQNQVSNLPNKYDLSIKNDDKPQKTINPEQERQKLDNALKEDIKKLPEDQKKWTRQRMIFKGNFNKKLPDAQQKIPKKQCPICRYERKLIKNSECPHQLCNDCWDIWLKKDLRCPICRTRIREKYLIKQ